MASDEPLADPYQKLWRLDKEYLGDELMTGGLEQWTISSLCENRIRNQVAEHKRFVQEQRLYYQRSRVAVDARGETHVPTLAALATEKIIDVLGRSDDIVEDVGVVAKHLNSTSVKAIVRDRRTPYLALRAFMRLPADYGVAQVGETAKASIDIDEAILINERYLRVKPSTAQDDRDLIRLKDTEVVFDDTHVEMHNDRLVLTRKHPPKGGLEFFDHERQQRLEMLRTDEAFIACFNRITGNVLRGLNWDHVFIAGGVVLITLLATDPTKDSSRKTRDSDIDVYLYGLTPLEANEKVKEIYQVWSSNLPASNRQKLVVKNAKTITFIPSYPHRRIQIVLRLVPSPISVLLNFDLDPCAMGFNGREVLMLPRAVRALESGYSTFTMNLVWGHHLQDRRATQDLRVFKYADRGFGVRILPSYVRCLEEVDLPREPAGHSHVLFQCSRKPNGPEPGLKTLRRTAFMASSMLNYYYFGAPNLEDGMWDIDGSLEPADGGDDRWLGEWAKLKAIRAENERAMARKEGKAVPLIRLAKFDTHHLHGEFPGRRKGIGNFEVWMRHHEAWKLDASGHAALDRSSMAAVEYDLQEYNDAPDYQWQDSYDADNFAQDIDQYNDLFFRHLRRAVCHRIDPLLDPRVGGWRDYLTRRIRRVVHGPDIDSVFEKQITIPVVIPYDLEEFIQQTFRDALVEAGIDLNSSQDRLLIPVHVPGRGTHILPDIPENTDAVGNVRYWVVGNEVMWAGIDRRIDEIFEVLWALTHWFFAADGGHKLDVPDALLVVAQRFYQRLPMTFQVHRPMALILQRTDGRPSASKASTPYELEIVSGFDGHLEAVPRREAVLFQEWALRSARIVGRFFSDDGDPPEDQMYISYPPPDQLFWEDGDEGAFEPANVPQWT